MYTQTQKHRSVWDESGFSSQSARFPTNLAHIRPITAIMRQVSNRKRGVTSLDLRSLTFPWWNMNHNSVTALPISNFKYFQKHTWFSFNMRLLGIRLYLNVGTLLFPLRELYWCVHRTQSNVSSPVFFVRRLSNKIAGCAQMLCFCLSLVIRLPFGPAWTKYNAKFASQGHNQRLKKYTDLVFKVAICKIFYRERFKN